MAGLLRKLRPRLKVRLSSPEGLGLLARRVQEKFKIDITDQPDLSRSDLVVIVDTGHASLLSDWIEKLSSSKAFKLIIDHHPLDESIAKLGDNILIREDATSACEVVYELFKESEIEPTRNIAKVLLTGILYDSQHLTIADEKALRSVVELLEKGASLREAKQLLRYEWDYSEVIARLKAAQRLKAHRIGEWTVASTVIGSFQASAARGLIGLGADVAVALGEVEGVIRCSLRSTQNFWSKTGIHMGLNLAKAMASKFEGGSGGGHPTAASFNVRTQPKVALSGVTETLSSLLKSPFEEVA